MQELGILILALQKSSKKISDSLDTMMTNHQSQPSKATTAIPSHPASKAEMDIFFQALNQCETKASVLSLIAPYSETFVAKSQNMPVLSDLYEPTNLDLDYPELLQKCMDVEINVSEQEIKIVELDTRDQAKGPGSFRHRAGCKSVCDVHSRIDPCLL